MIQFLDPKALGVHLALKHIPRLAADSEGARAITASIATAGILEPLKTKAGLVVDGRERLRAALELHYDAVPCIEIADGEVHSVILHSLIARKHYTKSALAYLAQPFFERALDEGKKRRLENLKRGDESPDRQLRILSGNTEAAAEQLGINRQFLFSARNIHGHFKKEPALREHFEPLILSGEMGLGQVLQGIAGWEATKGKPKGEREQLLLWAEKIKGFCDPRKFAGWATAPDDVKSYVRAELMKGIKTAWPQDLVESVFGELDAR